MEIVLSESSCSSRAAAEPERSSSKIYASVVAACQTHYCLSAAQPELGFKALSLGSFAFRGIGRSRSGSRVWCRVRRFETQIVACPPSICFLEMASN